MTTMNDDDDRPVRNKNIENNVPHSEQLDPAKAAASAELQANAQGLVNSMAKEGKPLDKHYDEFIEKMEDQRSAPGTNWKPRQSKYFFGWSQKIMKITGGLNSSRTLWRNTGYPSVVRYLADTSWWWRTSWRMTKSIRCNILLELAKEARAL